MRDLASGMRLVVGKLMVVVPGPGAHRTAAGDEILCRRKVVNVGSSVENGIMKSEVLWRCARSPRTSRRCRSHRRMAGAVEFFDFVAGVGEGIREFGGD
jgi:hypothetical protein